MFPKFIFFQWLNFLNLMLLNFYNMKFEIFVIQLRNQLLVKNVIRF